MAERRRALADRVLRRLAMARARVGLLQRRLRRGEALDPQEAAAHLADVDQAVGEAARLAEEVRGPSAGSGDAGAAAQGDPIPSGPSPRRVYLRRPEGSGPRSAGDPGEQ